MPAGVDDEDGSRLKPGSPIGEYEITELLGQGGFGTVYRAIHPVIGKSAAIKVLKRELSANPEVVTRFISEARAVNQIRHKNIIDIFSFGKLDDGRQYFVMELLEGQPLDRALHARRRLTIGEALPILRPVARALGAAHAAGITHRDIKPENIFLTFDEDHQVIPKLLDFGIAKLATPGSESASVTRPGVPMGTPLYMSPEQVHGKDIDPRSDVYSFGVMVYQLLSGRVPFDGETVMSIMVQHLNTPPPRPSSVEPSLAPLDAPILKMLDKDPERRPKSVVDAVDDLARAAAAAGLVDLSSATPLKLDPLSKPGPSLHPARTPGSLGDKTIAQLESSDTLVASETIRDPSLVPSKKKVSWATLGVAGGAFAVVGVVVAALAARQDAPSASSPAAAASTEVSAAPTEPTAPAPAGPTVTPTVAEATSAQPIAPSKEVKLVIKTLPEGAEVWRGKDKLGNAGDPLTLPRGAEKIELLLKKNGYLPHKLTVTPSDDVLEAITLKVAPRTRPEHGEF
ncbi:MAG: serine/threonine protein kinase [Polyangiaceae bacterium]|jgi:serine/threonine protein kinase|nr:serine/threonine protein kinase [Polyangiaceae bacterium]